MSLGEDTASSPSFGGLQALPRSQSHGPSLRFCRDVASPHVSVSLFCFSSGSLSLDGAHLHHPRRPFPRSLANHACKDPVSKLDQFTGSRWTCVWGTQLPPLQWEFHFPANIQAAGTGVRSWREAMTPRPAVSRGARAPETSQEQRLRNVPVRRSPGKGQTSHSDNLNLYFEFTSCVPCGKPAAEQKIFSQ